MAKGIRGITIEIDGNVTGLNKALGKVNKGAKDVQDELKQVDKLLKFNPGNTELIAQKQELLAKQIENTSDKLKVLKQAQADVDKQFQSGKINEEQYRAFNRELVDTESKLGNLKSQLEQAGQAQEDLGRKTRQLETLFNATGKSVDDFKNDLGTGLTNAIKNGTASSKQLDDAIEKVGRAALNTSADLDQIKSAVTDLDNGSSLSKVQRNLRKIGSEADDAASKAKTLRSELKDVAQGLGTLGAAGAAGATGLVEGMQDYNQTLARLRTNAEMTGNDLGVVEDAFREIVAVTGEADSAIETVSNLLAVGFKDNQMADMIDQINGAAIKFSDTLKTEGIADGIQETFATGEAIGQFAELLERSGVDLDGFNEKLQGAQTEGEKTQLILDTMANLGFGMVTEKYKEMNPEIQRNAEANANLQQALAELAVVLTPLIVSITNIVTKIAEWAANNPTLVTTIVAVMGVVGALMAIFVALTPVIAAVSAIAGIVGVSFMAMSGIVLAVIAVIAALVAAGVALYKNWDTVKAKASSIWDGIKSTISNAVSNASKAVTDKFSQIQKTMTDKITSAKNTISKIVDQIKGFFSNMKLKMPKIQLPKLPHFKLTGSFSLNPPSVPRLSVDWFDKGGVFYGPQVIGVNFTSPVTKKLVA